MNNLYYVAAFAQDKTERYPFEILGAFPTAELAEDVCNIMQRKHHRAYNEKETNTAVKVEVYTYGGLTLAIDEWGENRCKNKE